MVWHFPLAGLDAGQGEFFLLGSIINVFLLGSVTDVKWQCLRASPSDLLTPRYFFSINLIYLFYFYLFLPALGLRCCTRAFSSCGEQGLLFITVRGLLIALASLAAEHGLQARGLKQLWLAGFSSCGSQASVVVARGLQSTGSVVVAHRYSCAAACGIFPDQGPNPCPLHWQADS